MSLLRSEPALMRPDEAAVVLDRVARDRNQVRTGNPEPGDLLGVDQRIIALRDQIGRRALADVAESTAQTGSASRGGLAGNAAYLDLVHRQIAAWLRRRIESGEFPPGLKIPCETDIGQETGVARSTAKGAIAAA